MQTQNSRPNILCFAGLDPSGGAGLQADIEAIAHCGGHALPIASCLTVQNSTQAFKVVSVEPELIQQQVEALLQDTTINACKIGVINNQDIAHIIANMLDLLPDSPVVLDPVLRASQGIEFCSADTIAIIKDSLLPHTHIITPNAHELALLAGTDTDEIIQAQLLLDYGVQYVLVTGADTNTEQVTNTLYSNQGIVDQQVWTRLPHHYHGSGCTLSSAIACHLALGLDAINACQAAQAYTWQALSDASQQSQGQFTPMRIKS